jgi:hypothetical protein
MHYIIALTLMKYYCSTDRDMHSTAGHICLALRPIKERVLHRYSFRKFLFEAAQRASENGARSTSMYYYSCCMNLLQPDPWDETLEDVHYEEVCFECAPFGILGKTELMGLLDFIAS